MTETVSHKNHFEITRELKALANAVPGASIKREGRDNVPVCTVDGKREVVSMDGKFDLWVPRRKPKIGVINEALPMIIEDTVTPWTFGASFDQAVAFLYGATKKDVLSMEAQS